MKNKGWLIILLIVLMASCKMKDEFEGVFVTGDHTGVMRVWQGEKNNLMTIANFSDSTQITYPAYLLQINEKYGIFHVQNSDAEPTNRYYVLKPAFTTNDRQALELTSLKLIFGKGVINGEEIINPDDTKTVILEGGIYKR